MKKIIASASDKTVAKKTSVSYLTVNTESAGQRIDNFLFKHLKGVPKSHIYRLLRKGEVRVNKKRIDADYKLVEQDIVRLPPVRTAEKAVEAKLSQNLQQLLQDSILYEDEGLLIINKPAGLAVHGGSGINFGVIESLRKLWPEKVNLELVHRLDRDTSGCLLIAKKNAILRELHEMLRNNQVEKRYLVLVKGYWPRHLKEIDVSLRKYELRSGERMVEVNAALGKQAITQFRVLQRFAETTLVEALLLTGRTHQIRVHAQHAGHPIIGDEKYGDKDFNGIMRKMGAKRLCLHAHNVAFTLASGKEISVAAPLSIDFQKFLDKLSVNI